MGEKDPGDGRETLNPAALSVDAAAAVLSRFGQERITAEMVVADLAAGAPANRDGTLNLIHYTAWLAREAE